jgi:hypothetical protein
MDRKGNVEIRRDLRTGFIEGNVKKCRARWLERLQGMDDKRGREIEAGKENFPTPSSERNDD